MKCDQCNAAMINGIFCHERGCPNTRKRWDNDSQEWRKVYTCPECGGEFFDAEEAYACCNGEEGGN